MSPAPQDSIAPASLHELSLDQRGSIVDLALQPAAIKLRAHQASAQFTRNARAYIKAARLTGTPASAWLVERVQSSFFHRLSPPLAALFSNYRNGVGRAPAAQALLNAGCSLWACDWTLFPERAEVEQEPYDPSPLARYLVKGDDPELRRLFFTAAFTDPAAPLSFFKAFCSEFDSVVEQASLAPGSIAPADEAALALCSFVAERSDDLAAAPARHGWGRARRLASQAKSIARLKRQPALIDTSDLSAPPPPGFVDRSDSLRSIMDHCSHDPGMIELAFDSCAALKERPQLACANFESRMSLLCASLDSPSPAALEWLSRSGANLWLAAAQDGEPDACQWALGQLDDNASPAFISPIARMLFDGSFILGPKGPSQCLGMAHQLAAKEPSEASLALLAALERLDLQRSAESASPSSPSPAPARPRAL